MENKNDVSSITTGTDKLRELDADGREAMAEINPAFFYSLKTQKDGSKVWRVIEERVALLAESLEDERVRELLGRCFQPTERGSEGNRRNAAISLIRKSPHFRDFYDYPIEGVVDESWRIDVERVVQSSPKELSAYAVQYVASKYARRAA